MTNVSFDDEDFKYWEDFIEKNPVAECEHNYVTTQTQWVYCAKCGDEAIL